MGIFDFFRKKEAPQQVALKDLDGWLDTYLDSRSVTTKVKVFKQRSNSKMNEILGALEALGHAKLHNPDIPARAKHIMQGNRDSYIKRLNTFFAAVQFPESYEDVPSFAVKFSKDIDGLSASTQKSFFVLREFFEDELKIVARRVKELEDMVVDLRKTLDDERLEQVQSIRQNLRQIDNAESEKKQLAKQLRKEKDILKGWEDRKERIKSKIQELKSSNSYKNVHKAEKELEELEKEERTESQDFLTKMSAVKHALKKYAKDSLNENIINHYLDDSVSALANDDELKIIEVLTKLGDGLDKYESKTKKREKVAQTIKELNPVFLSKISAKLHKSRETRGELKSQIKRDTTRLSISEQESFLASAQENMDKQKKALKDIENRIEAVNPVLIMQKIKKNLNQLGKVELKES